VSWDIVFAFFADFILSCDATISWDIDLGDEGPLVSNLFWDVWHRLPEDSVHTWQEVLHCVKLMAEGKDMGLVDHKLLAYIESA
jgi:hypothetical protein